MGADDLDMSIEAMHGAVDSLSLALDVVDAQLAEAAGAKPWRTYGIGCGDLAKLFLALGRRSPDIAPNWLREEVVPMKSRGNVSRFLLLKAGKVRRLAQGGAQTTGLDREAELFCEWVARVENGWCDGGLDLEPDSLMYAAALPREFPPFCDPRFHPRLVARIDVWGRTRQGTLVLPSLKCARYGYRSPAWWNGIDAAPWYYELQSQGEMAVCGADHALLVIGCGWIRDADDPREDGEIKVLRIDRNEALIAEIRDAVAEGWERIEGLRAA